jgi:peroxiredoxin
MVVAAIFHLLWGVLSLVFPSFVLRMVGAPVPEPLFYWQALGLSSLALAIGLGTAAREPSRHWPVALMGLSFHLVLAAATVSNILAGTLPLGFAWVTVLHDGLWLGPLAWVLVEAHALASGRRRHASPEVRRMALRTRTSEQMSLDEMTRRWPTMLVFLRHLSCPFCREALTELAALRPDIEKTGTRIAFVHMSTDEEASALFGKFGLGDLPRISDPGCVLYRAFGLSKGSLGQVLGPKSWLRGFQLSVLRGYGIGGWFDDLFQMPGIFLLFHGEVLNSYLHQTIADRPNYLAILEPTFADDPGVEV